MEESGQQWRCRRVSLRLLELRDEAINDIVKVVEQQLRPSLMSVACTGTKTCAYKAGARVRGACMARPTSRRASGLIGDKQTAFEQK